MKELTYYPNRKKENKSELYVDFGSLKDYKVFIPTSGTRLELYRGSSLISKVGGTYIQLFGRDVPTKTVGLFKWAWILSENPECLLFPQGDKYVIDKEVVAEVIDETAVSSNLFDLFKAGDGDGDGRYLKLVYDEEKLDEVVAIALLLVDISRARDTL